jgi:hypothetical protein
MNVEQYIKQLEDIKTELGRVLIGTTTDLSNLTEGIGGLIMSKEDLNKMHLMSSVSAMLSILNDSLYEAQN